MTLLLGVLGAILLVGIVVGQVIDHYTRWDIPVHPYECFACRTRFKTAKLLVAHMHGNHDVDFDDHEVTVLRGYRLGGGE